MSAGSRLILAALLLLAEYFQIVLCSIMKRSTTIIKLLREYCALDLEGKQEIIIGVIRKYLLQLPTLSEEAHEHLLSLWLECYEGGMGVIC